MKSVLYILLFAFLMLLTTNSIGINTVANGQTLPVPESRFADAYIRNAPPSIQVAHAIKKYAPAYDVPLNVAYKIARLETNFKGPLQFRYDAAQTSSADAYGPMQILLSTGREVSRNPELTKEQLLNDIDLNVMIGLKYMRQLYDIYHDWSIAAGFYNSGRPQINSYAMEVRSILNN